MKTGVILDLDDTLADARRRMPLWGDWDAFYKDAINDPPIEEMCNLARLLTQCYGVTIITAREEKYRDMTERWLAKHRINYNKLIMRREEDRKVKSPEFKIQAAIEHIGPNFAERIALVIDDREDVLANFRVHGVVTLQATYGHGRPMYSGLEAL